MGSLAPLPSQLATRQQRERLALPAATCPTKICPSILVRQVRRTDRQELGGIAPNEVVQRMTDNIFGIMAAGAQLRVIRKPHVQERTGQLFAEDGHCCSLNT